MKKRPRECTETAIDESVQFSGSVDAVQELPADYVQVQVFRGGLRTYLDRQRPTIVGNNWHPRAIVLPLQIGDTWPKNERKRNARLRRQLEACIKELR